MARTQSQIVANALERAHPGLHVELTILKTSGDQIADRPLHEVGGKGLFTKELEQALLDGRIDFAVHSFKDMPTTMPLVEQQNLIVAAVPEREDPRDVLVCDKAGTIADLPAGARVGTGSLRRRCQLLALRPDLQILPIRGNIDTRLRKQREGECDALVLALAGIRRTGLFDPATMHPLDTAILLPAPAQGALALQCRADDESTRALLAALNDPSASACAAAERALVALLEGDCLSPIAALAIIGADRLTLHAKVGARGGEPPVISATARANADNPQAAAQAAFEMLVSQGAPQMLRGRT